ncbi:MAG: phosphosulfolactate synthase, partial [Pseudomonadota bacterium]
MNACSNKKAFDFIEIIERAEKPRSKGLVMVLDKGLGLSQAQDLMQAAPYIDIVKLGWATPRLFPEDMIQEKIRLYKKHDILVGNGGTLLEIAHQQRKIDQFLMYCRKIGIELIEVSNGVLNISSDEKTKIIRNACSLGFSVISEVGKKEPSED